MSGPARPVADTGAGTDAAPDAGGAREDPPGDALHLRPGSGDFRAASRALFAVGLGTFAVLYCVQPLQPAFSQAFDLSPAQSSLSLSLTTGMLAPMLLVASTFADGFGRKRLLVGSMVVCAVLTALAACAPGWGTLLGVRLVTGIALSGLQAVAMAYVGEEVAPDAVGYAMGLFISGSSLGGLAGRLMSGFVGGALSWRFAMAAIALTTFAAGAYVWRAMPESRHFHPSRARLATRMAMFRHHLSDRRLRGLYAIALLNMGGFVSVYSLIGYRLLAPPYAFSQALVSAIFLIYLLGAVVSTAAGRLADTYGRQRIMLGGIGLSALGVGATLAASPWLIVAGMAVFTAGFFAIHATASGWVSRLAPVGRAQASALYLFAFYVGSSVVASLVALLWPHAGWPGVGWTVLALLAATMLVALTLGRESA